MAIYNIIAKLKKGLTSRSKQERIGNKESIAHSTHRPSRNFNSSLAYESPTMFTDKRNRKIHVIAAVNLLD